MTFTEKVKAITTAYSDLRNIESEKDLRDNKLTLAEYHACMDVFNDISRPNTSTKTFMTNVAEYFKRHGYIVSYDNANYIISI